MGDGRGFGLTVHYSFDGRELLGTGGAIKRALPLLGDRFFVLNGDSYLRCSYDRIQGAHEAGGYPALMAVLRNDNRWDRSNVRFRDGKVLEYDKGTERSDLSHIDFGLSVLSAAAAQSGGSEFRDFSDICQELSRKDSSRGSRWTTASTRSVLRRGSAIPKHICCAGRLPYELRKDAPGRDCSHSEIDGCDAIERMAAVLAGIKAAAGRVFFLGVGGSAANCSHAVNDFRKLAGIECYAPTDNVSELTARINDDGWESTFRRMAAR